MDFQPGPDALAAALPRGAASRPGRDAAVPADQAAAAAGLLGVLANEKRLLLLCMLIEGGEMTVGNLATALGLSQPALSRHLALLRRQGVVAPRRIGQSVAYGFADPRAARLLQVLHDIYCPQIAAPPLPGAAP